MPSRASTLAIAVQRHRGYLSIPASSRLTLETAAQHQNEHRMTAERVPFITHTPFIDPDALSCAERTMQSINIWTMFGRPLFRIDQRFAEDCSIRRSNRDDGDADLVDAGRCRFLLQDGYSFALEDAVQKPPLYAQHAGTYCSLETIEDVQ